MLNDDRVVRRRPTDNPPPTTLTGRSGGNTSADDNAVAAEATAGPDKPEPSAALVVAGVGTASGICYSRCLIWLVC